MKYANLHLHSTYSDAQFTPEQLCLIGKSLGYRAIALTDHDTDGGVCELIDYAKKLGGIDILIGSELTGLYEGVNLHLVSLDYDMKNPALREFINERTERRVESTRRCFEYGVEAGIITDITWNDVLRHHGEGAWLCIDSVYNTYRLMRIPAPADLRGRVFNAPETRQFRFKSAPAEKVIKLVREAGGVVGLAHPGYYNIDWMSMIPSLIELGLNGIEISHPDNIMNHASLAHEVAKKYNLYHLGGTDHTGPMSGCNGHNAVPAPHGVTEEEYFAIKERRLG